MIPDDFTVATADWANEDDRNACRMLRRQMVRDCRKPLIVMTPKSLLRHKMAVSSLDELATGSFQRVIPDTTSKAGNKLRRIVLCSGKVYYDLVEEAAKRGVNDVAIIRVEQLYPFPRVEVTAQIDKYPATTEVVWCQEEPQNQGAWYRLREYFRADALPNQVVAYAGRPVSASTAVGYMSKHTIQQQQLIEDAFSPQLAMGAMLVQT